MSLVISGNSTERAQSWSRREEKKRSARLNECHAWQLSKTSRHPWAISPGPSRQLQGNHLCEYAVTQSGIVRMYIWGREAKAITSERADMFPLSTGTCTRRFSDQSSVNPGGGHCQKI
jgi:hypothetical protein